MSVVVKQLNSYQRLDALVTLPARVHQRGINMKVLQKLEDEYIVSLSLSKDNKSMEVMECCDYHYKANLIKVEVRALLIELDFIYNQMED